MNSPILLSRRIIHSSRLLSRNAFSRLDALLLDRFRQRVIVLCRVCQSKAIPFQRTFGKFWYKCPECGFLQAEVSAALWRDLVKGEGFSAGTGVGGGGYREYYIARLCHDDLGLQDILLYGTGNTQTFSQFRAEGFAAWGCDLSRAIVALRQSEYGEGCFFHPDDLPSMRFDVIVAVEVFEHLVSPMRTLRLLRNHLSEHGVIAGTTDFYDGSDIWSHVYLAPRFHVAYWSQSSLDTAASMFGFQLMLFELECPGSVKPDQRYGILWPRKRVFFLYPERHRGYFSSLRSRFPILPIDRP